MYKEYHIIFVGENPDEPLIFYNFEETIEYIGKYQLRVKEWQFSGDIVKIIIED